MTERASAPFWPAVLVASVFAMGTAHANAPDDSAAMSPVESAVPQSLLLKFLADKSTFTLIDARSPEEYAESHIDGAINVPHDRLDDYDQSLPPSPAGTVIVYCRTGKRAGELRAQLTELGFRDVRVLQPGQIFASEGLMVFNCGATTEESLVVNKDAREEGKPQ